MQRRTGLNGLAHLARVDHAQRDGRLHHLLHVFLQLRKVRLSELLHLLILRRRCRCLELGHVLRVRGVHTCDVLLVELIARQRREDLDLLLLLSGQSLRQLQSLLLGRLLKLLAHLLVILHDPLGHLLDLLALRFL